MPLRIPFALLLCALEVQNFAQFLKKFETYDNSLYKWITDALHNCHSSNCVKLL